MKSTGFLRLTVQTVLLFGQLPAALVSFDLLPKDK